MDQTPAPRRHRLRWLIVVVALLCVLAGGGVLTGEHLAVVVAPASSSLLPTALAAPPTQAPGLVDVAELALSRTVTVEVVTASQEQLGTAWLFDSHGDFVTNAHVISGHVALRLRQRDGTVLEASIAGVDLSQDVAVLHSETPVDTTALPLDPVPPRVGQPVVVIASGRATGHDDITVESISHLGVTVTATNKDEASVGGPTTYKGMIQLHGETVYPGNSGGPVLDTSGEVVGILTLATPGQPVSYAIPISRVETDIAGLAAG